jgi:hypothetical protein
LPLLARTQQSSTPQSQRSAVTTTKQRLCCLPRGLCLWLGPGSLPGEQVPPRDALPRTNALFDSFFSRGRSYERQQVVCSRRGVEKGTIRERGAAVALQELLDAKVSKEDAARQVAEMTDEQKTGKCMGRMGESAAWVVGLTQV